MFIGTDYVDAYCRAKETYNHRIEVVVDTFLKYLTFFLGNKKCKEPPAYMYYTDWDLIYPYIHQLIHSPIFSLAENTAIYRIMATFAHPEIV